MDNSKEFYRRNLPHWQPKAAVLFITARLYGSLPKNKIEELRYFRLEEIKRLQGLLLSKTELQEKVRTSQELYFGKFDALLDHILRLVHIG